MLVYFSDSLRSSSMLTSRSFGAAGSAAAESSRMPGADPGAVFLSRAAVRETRDSTCATTLDRDMVYYMDAGVWGLGSDGNTTTTFGLVSGPDILVVDWLNMRREGAALDATANSAGTPYSVSCGSPSSVEEWWNTLAPGARRFLQVAQGQQRGYVLGAARAPADLTSPDQPLIILPDLHIRLRTDRALDLFRWGDPLVQLDSELILLKDIARDEDITTAQAGDLYETWETEILLRLRFAELVESARESIEYFRRHGGSASTLRDDMEYMISSRRMLKDMLFNTTRWSDWGHAHPHEMSRSQIDAASVLLTSTEDIERAIRAQHRGVFNSDGTLTDHDVRGNHDNNLANRYWQSVAPDRYRDYEELRDLTAASGSDSRPASARLGENDCIWLEHGHKYDWHNNDSDWWGDGRGFDTVEMMVHGAVWIGGVLASDSAANWAVNRARSGADLWTDATDTEMRHFTLLRVDELINNERDLVLVALGHTHGACLMEGNRGTSFFWQHPHAQHYLDSGYCLDSARQLAESLPGAPSR